MTLRGIRWCGMGFPLFAFAGGTQNSFVHAQRSSFAESEVEQCQAVARSERPPKEKAEKKHKTS